MYKILIIEDDRTIANVLAEHLRTWDYEVYCVTNFKNVMEDFREYEPQLVLLDIVLPLFNGFHWCQEIRKISKVPIIFLSSANDNMNIVMAMNMGGDEFVEKPFDLSVVTAKVQAVLRRAYAFRGTMDVLEHAGVMLNVNDATVICGSQSVELTKKLLGSFLKEKRGDICLYIGFIGVFYVIFSLSNLPADAVNYAFFLSAIWLLGYGIFKFNQYYKKGVAVIEAKQRLEEVTENLPATRSYIELEYQAIIQNMYKKMSDLQSAERIGRQEMKDYYSMWAHQIKTPIAAMKVLAQAAGDTEDARTYELLQDMQTELFKTEQYVEMVLTYVRMEDMSGDLMLKEYALDNLVKQALKKYSRMFAMQKLALHYEALRVTVTTDEKWLVFVLEQILSNALKYTVEGSISIYMEDDWLVIEDTGIGICSEDLPRIFEKGFTGYNGRSDKKSTGIGLYLCKQIIEKLRCQIRVESKLGKGTRVLLHLMKEKLPVE